MGYTHCKGQWNWSTGRRVRWCSLFAIVFVTSIASFSVWSKMTSFTKLKCRWTSVLALSLPSKLNLILFYCHIQVWGEIWSPYFFCMTLSTELSKTIMVWIRGSQIHLHTQTARIKKNMSMVCSKYYVTKLWQRSKCKGRWLHYIYWSNCKWPDSSSTMSNELILGAPGGNHWLIDWLINWFMEGSTRLWTWPFLKKKKSDCILYAYSVANSAL